jgi:hypothetical protein
MIQALRGFDRTTALGVLSRAALALLSSDANPSAVPSLENELALRGQIISELADRIGLSPADLADQGSRDRLSDALDEEAETLDTVDSEAALGRLSERGELPSDLFNVIVDDNQIRQVYGDALEQERKYILDTVRSPEEEYHFGSSVGSDQPALISILGRRFPGTPRRSGFYHIVSGRRDGTSLIVRQAWRMYEDEIDLMQARTVLGALKSFAEKYGLTVKIGIRVGKFIHFALVPPGQPPNVELVEGNGFKDACLSFNLRPRPDGFNEISFAMAINLNRYWAVMRRREALRENEA